MSRRRPAWFDRSGKEVGAPGTPDENNLRNPELSPDGQRFLMNITADETAASPSTIVLNWTGALKK